MDCKCLELKSWLNKEIKHLKKLQNNLTENSKLHNMISSKIDAYLIILETMD